MSVDRVVGRVKWFNNKAGYGFITVTEGDKKDSDVFVHHSSIPLKDQYKYLVQGEYVDFSFIPTKEGAVHEVQAGDVKGINGGMLMCETRRTYRSTRPVKSTNDVEAQVSADIEVSPKTVRGVNVRGSGPREGDWKVVSKENMSSKTDSSDPPKKRGRPPRVSQPKE